jgi:hypothetical protein
LARVVPSQVVDLIDTIFPWADKPTGQTETLYAGHAERVSVIVDYVEQLPSELVALEGRDYAPFATSLTTMKHALKMWPTHGSHFVASTPGFRLNPITLLREALAKCADDAPRPDTADLNFIADNDFRESLRQDVSTAHTALMNGEWKPATVIAGSVVEALLLWSLQQRSATDIATSTKSLQLSRDPKDLLSWILHPLIEVASDLKILNKTTTDQCRIAKDFRNLIHPGRAERLNTRCNRGTALSAVAAMEHVIADLE